MIIPEKELIFKETKTFPARRDELDSVIAYLEEKLEAYDCPMRAAMKLDVALEEMFVNIASYAYAEEGEAELTVSVAEGAVELTLVDSGVPFNPLEKPDPDPTLSAEERKIGGLGIFMVKKSMDSVEYARIDGKNIFSMMMKI